MKNPNAIQARVKSAIFTLCIALTLLFFLSYIRFSLPESTEKYFILLNFQDETQTQRQVNQSQFKKEQALTDKIPLNTPVKEGSLMKQDHKKAPAIKKNRTKGKVLIVSPKKKKTHFKSLDSKSKEALKHTLKKSKNTYKVKQSSSQKKSTSSAR